MSQNGKQHYNARNTNDDLDRKKAKSMKESIGITGYTSRNGLDSDTVFAIIGIELCCVLLLIVLSADSNYTLGWFTLILVGIGLAGCVKVFKMFFGLSDKRERLWGLCSEWKQWKQQREYQYYGNVCSEWSCALDVLRFGVFDNTISKQFLHGEEWKKYVGSCEDDPWTAESMYSVKRIDVESLVIPTDDGAYDYTDYFVELVYRHAIAAWRYGITPHILNWAQAFSYYFWQSSSSELIQNGFDWQEYAFKKQFYPFVKYPIISAQQTELCTFDYLGLESSEYVWIKNVWSKGMKKFEKDKAEKLNECPHFHKNLYSEAISTYSHIDSYNIVQKTISSPSSSSNVWYNDIEWQIFLES